MASTERGNIVVPVGRGYSTQRGCSRDWFVPPERDNMGRGRGASLCRVCYTRVFIDKINEWERTHTDQINIENQNLMHEV